MLNHKTITTIGIIILLAIGLSFAGGRSDKEVKEETNLWKIDTTKLEKYERKVIIKAKVGKGPGEIGVIGEGETVGPSGIAIDDKGQIYILDGINHRISKFSQKGEYITSIVLSEKLNLPTATIDNVLFIDENNNFYVKIPETEVVAYKFDSMGKLIETKEQFPKYLLNTQHKSVKEDFSSFLVKADKNRIISYEIADSLQNREYIIKLPLVERIGWEYLIFGFLGFDLNGNSYVQVVAREIIQASDVSVERVVSAVKEQIIFKHNSEGRLVAKIRVNVPRAGTAIWIAGNDGSLYMLNYSFKKALRDLPSWVEESNIPDEEKEKYRESYLVPEEYVYVIKFTKMEEK
jgi:hypothetical protein